MLLALLQIWDQDLIFLEWHIDALYDNVVLTKKGKGVVIVSSDNIPLNPSKNTAGLVVSAMKKKFKLKDGIEIKIRKMFQQDLNGQ